MNKKLELEKVLRKANKQLKNTFRHYHIDIDGDFSHEYNFVSLVDGYHIFPIATCANVDEAIVAINSYMSGISHSSPNSYVRHCDHTEI